jgi:UDP-N-acetylglucosamine 2-epimerase (hydrolysing)
MEHAKMKRIVFLTGTRADYGKLKALMEAVEKHPDFELHVFVTGMHMLSKYGSTYKEVLKDGFKLVYQFVNTRDRESMDITLSNTIVGFSNFISEFQPDLIVVHGDRVEALAGAIVGALNNVKVAHIEGGEISGTIDESIRHAITKFAHIHMVANRQAAKHVIQLGEKRESVFEIGSPDIDIMYSPQLPTLEEAKERYDIPFIRYSILMFHPVTTEIANLREQINEIVQAILQSDENFIVIYPNNDEGNQYIFEAYEQLKQHKRFKLFPSLRFEYFLTLLRHANMIIGNSSAGIREAGVYATSAIDIGNRQKGRYTKDDAPHVISVLASQESILTAMKQSAMLNLQPQSSFGKGDSVERFIKVLEDERLWEYRIQKQFIPR